MPKAQYGEMSGAEPGIHRAIIYQVISLGHQEYKGAWRSRLFVSLELENGTTLAVNNFGIYTWLSQSKPPFIGLYELISAATNDMEPTSDKLKSYNVFDLVGKTVSVRIEEANGYKNITQVVPCDEPFEGSRVPYAFGKEDIANASKLAELEDMNRRAYSLVLQSKEYSEARETATQSEAKTDDIITDAEDDLRLDEVPF